MPLAATLGPRPPAGAPRLAEAASGPPRKCPLLTSPQVGRDQPDEAPRQAEAATSRPWISPMRTKADEPPATTAAAAAAAARGGGAVVPGGGGGGGEQGSASSPPPPLAVENVAASRPNLGRRSKGGGFFNKARALPTPLPPVLSPLHHASCFGSSTTRTLINS